MIGPMSLLRASTRFAFNVEKTPGQRVLASLTSTSSSLTPIAIILAPRQLLVRTWSRRHPRGCLPSPCSKLGAPRLLDSSHQTLSFTQCTLAGRIHRAAARLGHVEVCPSPCICALFLTPEQQQDTDRHPPPAPARHLSLLRRPRRLCPPLLPLVGNTAFCPFVAVYARPAPRAIVRCS
jgi:hypothetical protein